MKLLLLTYQTYFRLLDLTIGNKYFIQKLPGCHFSVNVLVLRDVLRLTSIFLLPSAFYFCFRFFPLPLLVSSDLNHICEYFVKFFNFLSCVEITLLTAFPSLCLIQLFNTYKVCKIFAWSFPNFLSLYWCLFNELRSVFPHLICIW